MPPFDVVAAALRKTTERLAAEIASDSSEVPDWNEREWAIAQAAAAMQGISALLANRARWAGPPTWQAFLAEQREHSVLRHAHSDAVLRQIDSALRERGVACVALKGAALRALDLYGPGERPMGDVDLLARPRDLPALAAALDAVDFVEAYATLRHRVYEPRYKTVPCGFGEHVDSPLKIEVHTAVAEPLPVHKVDITARLLAGAAQPGLNAYPDTVALLLHLLLHAAGNVRAHALRQIQLHDIARVARLLHARHWSELLAQRHGNDGTWWMFPPLALTARYYRGSIPAEVLRTARAACPRMLRLAIERQSLTDVSWSNLRIHAFPGIAWSRTPLEALRFVRARVVPSRVALADLERARRALPQLEQVPWYGMAHGSRVLRWLFSRPPRVQTIASVRAALRNASGSLAKAR
jgi:hypothetical protein